MGNLPPIPTDLVILAPTLLEYAAVRLVRPPARAVHAGVALARRMPEPGAVVIVCGLAGALVTGLRPGTILIPREIGLPDGTRVACDGPLVELLIAGARRGGYKPETSALITAAEIVTGNTRRKWSERGFAAADMETGLLIGAGRRFATVRVILDSPDQSISGEWLTPWRVLTRPDLWREMAWLSATAPRYSLRAARVVCAALRP